MSIAQRIFHVILQVITFPFKVLARFFRFLISLPERCRESRKKRAEYKNERIRQKQQLQNAKVELLNGRLREKQARQKLKNEKKKRRARGDKTRRKGGNHYANA